MNVVHGIGHPVLFVGIVNDELDIVWYPRDVRGAALGVVVCHLPFGLGWRQVSASDLARVNMRTSTPSMDRTSAFGNSLPAVVSYGLVV